MDRKERIEKVSESNTVRLRNQPEKIGIAFETPGFAGLHDLKVSLAITVDEFIGQLTFAIFVGQLDGNGADPGDIDYCYKPIRQNTFDDRTTF